jgi:sulfane dehydrogenase subunit SoxC
MSSSKRRGRSPSLDYVAGNGLISRRALLGQGFAIAGAVGAAGTVTGAAAEPLIDAPWGLEVGAITPPVQTPSD